MISISTTLFEMKEKEIQRDFFPKNITTEKHNYVNAFKS